MTIENKIADLIVKNLEEQGFKLIKVEYTKENKNNFLRVIIDRDEPISIDQCVVATKIINKTLDKENIIDKNYILDVCSNERGCN